MKKNISQILVVLMTFIVGVLAVSVWDFDSTNDLTTGNFESDKANTWKRILSFEDQDLNKLDNDQRIKLFNDFYRLFDKQKYVGYGKEQQFSKLLNEFGIVRYVLIGKVSPPIDHASSDLYLQIFDENGVHLNSIKINTNTRSPLENVKIRFSPEIQRESIEVTYEQMPDEGCNYTTQIYVLVGNEIAMIQVEKK